MTKKKSSRKTSKKKLYTGVKTTVAKKTKKTTEKKPRVKKLKEIDTTLDKLEPGKMNNKIKELWVKSLKSNVYKQIPEDLRSDEGFSAIGVLCDLYDRHTKGPTKWRRYECRIKEYRYEFMGYEGYPPLEVYEWAGLLQFVKDKLHPELIVNVEDNDVSLNDVADTLSFEDFAQIIKVNL